MEGNISPVKSRSAFLIDAQTPVLSTMAHCIQDVQRAMILYTSGILVVITSKQQYRLTASLQQAVCRIDILLSLLKETYFSNGRIERFQAAGYSLSHLHFFLISQLLAFAIINHFCSL